jgi:hypothetical protein
VRRSQSLSHENDDSEKKKKILVSAAAGPLSESSAGHFTFFKLFSK